MGATTKDLESWVEKMMTKKGIKKYKLDSSGSSSKGDGYLGEICFLKVICDIGKGEEKVYDIVVKSAKTNEDLRKNSPIAETYLREIFVYSEIFPTIEKFQKEFAIENGFVHHPICYSVCKLDRKEALLLSNLKSLGYDVHDRKVSQNFEHVKLVFRTYALWHGSSMALKIKRPELFKELTKDLTDVMANLVLSSQMVPIFQLYVERGIDLLKKKGKEINAKKIQAATKDIFSILTKMTLNYDKEAQKEAVILHGDCWNNNMMFKYKDSDKSIPSGMVFIDFQISRLASPILDLSYYLYAIANQESLDNFDLLLAEYHKTLSNYLKQYDIDCEDVLTLKRLRESWKKYGTFGLVMNPFITRVELCQEDEVIDFAEKLANNTMSDIKMDVIKLQDEYDRRVFSVYNHFAEKFL